MFARLAPGATLDAARAQIAAIAANLEKDVSGHESGNVKVTPLATMVVGDVRAALFVLLGAVGFVLLIACANVAHMLLARASARHREMTVRLALGASRGRLLRQMLTESVVLALVGGALGIGLARLGLTALVSLAANSIPRADGIGLDLRVLAFTMVVSLLTGLGFGLLPAMRVSRDEMANALRDGARGSTEGADRSRARSVLVASEIALALVLLIGAGLAMRSFVALRAIDPGFDRAWRLCSCAVAQGDGRGAAGTPRVVLYDDAGSCATSCRESNRRVSSTTSRLRATCGVCSSSSRVVLGHGRRTFPRRRIGWSIPATSRRCGRRLVRGRDVTDADRVGTLPVAIVNELFARRSWPNEVGDRQADLDRSERRPSARG